MQNPAPPPPPGFQAAMRAEEERAAYWQHTAGEEALARRDRHRR